MDTFSQGFYINYVLSFSTHTQKHTNIIEISRCCIHFDVQAILKVKDIWYYSPIIPAKQVAMRIANSVGNDFFAWGVGGSFGGSVVDTLKIEINDKFH